MQYLVDNKISVACITESWLTDSNDFTSFRIKSYGYSVSHKHRELRRGGDVCFIYKLSNKVIESKSKRIYESFEYHLLELCTCLPWNVTSQVASGEQSSSWLKQYYVDAKEDEIL